MIDGILDSSQPLTLTTEYSEDPTNVSQDSGVALIVDSFGMQVSAVSHRESDKCM